MGKPVAAMKFLKIKNRMSTPLHFVFTTISSCRCSVCMEWLRCETSPIGNWPGQAFGSLAVGGFSERIDRFCPHWDCVGAVYFGHMPWRVTRDHFFDYHEDRDYMFAGGHAEMCFTHQLPTVVAPDCQVGTGLRLAMVAGRLALICAGAPDIGIIGDIISLFS